MVRGEGEELDSWLSAFDLTCCSAPCAWVPRPSVTGSDTLLPRARSPPPCEGSCSSVGSRVGRGAAGRFLVAAGSLEHEPAWSQGWEPKPPPPRIRPVILFPPLGLDTMNYGSAVGLVEFFFFACSDRSRVLCRVRGSISIHPSGRSEPRREKLLLAAGAGCHVHSILMSS